MNDQDLIGEERAAVVRMLREIARNWRLSRPPFQDVLCARALKRAAQRIAAGEHLTREPMTDQALIKWLRDAAALHEQEAERAAEVLELRLDSARALTNAADRIESVTFHQSTEKNP